LEKLSVIFSFFIFFGGLIFSNEMHPINLYFSYSQLSLISCSNFNGIKK